jgi:anti-sigma factor RsiW
VWDLLPWYANGTLADGERRTVAAHLAACARCREELAACGGLGEAVRGVPENAPAPHPAHFARIVAEIDAEDGRRSPWGALRELLTATPRAMRWALAAQLVLVLALLGLALSLGLGTGLVRRQPATYQTLADPAPAVPQATARLRIVFAPGTSEQDIRDLLLGIRGQIAAGPSPLGVYTVEVPAAPDPLADVLTHLRKHRQVSLAEPVDGGGRP